MLPSDPPRTNISQNPLDEQNVTCDASRRYPRTSHVPPLPDYPGPASSPFGWCCCILCVCYVVLFFLCPASSPWHRTGTTASSRPRSSTSASETAGSSTTTTNNNTNNNTNSYTNTTNNKQHLKHAPVSVTRECSGHHRKGTPGIGHAHCVFIKHLPAPYPSAMVTPVRPHVRSTRKGNTAVCEQKTLLRIRGPLRVLA